jgi:hypothetical protein
MYAVIGDLGDQSALWAADRLRARLGDVRLIPTDLLALTPDFHLTIEGEAVAAAFTLPDGTAVGPATCQGLLNRVTRPPAVAAAPSDAAYAAEEMTAITLAYLAAFGPRVVNRPDPASLFGRELGPQGWLHLAALAGLPAAPFRLDDGGAQPLPQSAAQVLVIGGHVFGATGAMATRAVDLAQMAGVQILSLALAADGRVVGATAQPDLSLAGEAGADALAELLTGLA